MMNRLSEWLDQYQPYVDYAIDTVVVVSAVVFVLSVYRMWVG